MKKNLYTVFVIVGMISALFHLTTVANAAGSLSGTSCETINQIKTVNSQKYICAKVSKSLKWQILTSTKFSAPIPIKLPVSLGANPEALTFENVISRMDDIPKVAWEKSQEVLKANSENPVTIDLHVGPNTVLDFTGGADQIRDVIQKTAKFWKGFSVSKYISVFAYNANDEPWAEKQWQAAAAARKYRELLGFTNTIRGNCQSSTAPGKFNGPVTRCGGSAAGTVSGTSDSAMTLGMTGDSKDIYVLTGALVGHEFTHVVQNSNWFGAPKCGSIAGNGCYWDSNGFSPCWLNEGQPNIMGRLIVSETFADYQRARKGLGYGWGPTTFTDYTQASLRDYLYNQSSPACYQNGAFYKLGYSVGALTSEILTSIAGPQSTMALYALGAEGYNFATAFKKVYGISWNEASTILSKVLAAEYAEFGPPPF